MITPNQIAELKGLATSNGRTERIRRLAEWYESGPSYPREFEQGRQQIAADLRALLAEIEAPRAEGWQDIGTAPKDGETEVLTYRKMGLQSVAVWTGELGWCCTDGVHLLDVTHWRPLPPPPKGQSNHDEA